MLYTRIYINIYNYDPSSEFSRGYMIQPMGNSLVSVVEAADSCDERTEGDHVITHYQPERAAAWEINRRISRVDPGLERTPQYVIPGCPPPPPTHTHKGYMKRLEMPRTSIGFHSGRRKQKSSI